MNSEDRSPIWVTLLSVVAVALSLSIIFVDELRVRSWGTALWVIMLPLWFHLFRELKRSGRGDLPWLQASKGWAGINSASTLVEWLATPFAAIALVLSL